MYQHKFVEIQKAHDNLLQEIAEKSTNQKSVEVNLMKLKNSYDSLLMDFKYVLKKKRSSILFDNCFECFLMCFTAI